MDGLVGASMNGWVDGSGVQRVASMILGVDCYATYYVPLLSLLLVLLVVAFFSLSLSSLSLLSRSSGPAQHRLQGKNVRRSIRDEGNVVDLVR